MAHLNIELPEELHQELRRTAVEYRVTVKALAIALLGAALRIGEESRESRELLFPLIPGGGSSEGEF